MDRNAVIAALAPAVFLYACDRALVPEDGVPTAVTAAAERASGAPATTATLPAMTSPVVDGLNDDRPDLTPPGLKPETERGATGARTVLLSFARALELKEFDEAWALLGRADKRKWSQAGFARNFAGLDTITVAIPDGTTNGQGDPISYRAPIVITATDRSGRPVRYEGEAVLKRVNAVDGATGGQLRWRFDRLILDWTH